MRNDMTSDGVLDTRTTVRANTYLAAIIYAGDSPLAVKIRDMSSTGAQLEGPQLPEVDTAINLVRGSLSVQGRISWRSEHRCGVQLSMPVSVRDWMAPPANPGQQRVDHIVAAVKGGALPLVAPADHQSGTTYQFAEDLRRISSLLEGLGNEFASDNEIVTKHATRLQDLDIAFQAVGALADALQGDVPTGEMTSRLDSLRSSCEAAVRSMSAPGSAFAPQKS